MHHGEDAMFTFHYISSYMTSLERQIRESLEIDSYKCDNILNGKGEWGCNLVPRASYSENSNKNLHHNLNRNVQNVHYVTITMIMVTTVEDLVINTIKLMVNVVFAETHTSMK